MRPAGVPSSGTARAPCVGRFAPSPTGDLHAGSLVAALASWLDVRARGPDARWLVRIEDVDTPRCVPGAESRILAQLSACGLVPDGPVLHQSERGPAYQAALDRLVAAGLAYPCACSRKDIEDALRARGQHPDRHHERVYPGTCRDGLAGRPARAWRLHTARALDRWRAQAGMPAVDDDAPRPDGDRVVWFDRRLGWRAQAVETAVGDFVLRRADGLWAYQLAVVVDDAAQGVTDVVRGEDLADNTARQILLQRALGLPTPRHLHTPLVRGADGEKLSKQNGARPFNAREPLAALDAAAAVLGLPPRGAGATLAQALSAWTGAWAAAWGERPAPTIRAVMQQPATETAPLEAGHSAHGVPPGVAHPQRVRSFVRRAGRTTTGQTRALEQFGPRFLIDYRDDRLDLGAAFGREAPTVLEIGFGMGEATAHIAARRPGDNFLCCEVHEPGVGALLKRIGEQGLQNIRIVAHDAVEVLDRMIAPASLAGVHIFFPDPWHKKRHHKRRLIQPELVARLASRLAPGGYLHCATDWEPYAGQMLAVLGAEPLLANTADGFAPRPDYRPLTKFENRGLRLGHGVWDLVFRRVDRAA